jgi:hypothetical protein
MRAREQMDQPTPVKKARSSDWPVVVFLCVVAVAAAAVCIVGMIKFL